MRKREGSEISTKHERERDRDRGRKRALELERQSIYPNKSLTPLTIYFLEQGRIRARATLDKERKTNRFKARDAKLAYRDHFYIQRNL